jgi:hypothetical protein
MIPAGYLLKRVVPPPEFLSDARVSEVCSVSDCVNDDVIDVQAAWRHNGFGVANDPSVLWSMAADAAADAGGVTLFYYEAYEREIESDGWTVEPDEWRPLSTVPSEGEPTAVKPPTQTLQARLIGFDVVVFGDFLEHSPLSCNHIAGSVPVNSHCLFDTLEAAKAAIDGGMFGGGCEEGIYRIFSVSVVTARPEAA